MISIVIPINEINNMQKWAKHIIIQCFEKKILSDGLELFNFFDDSREIENSELVQNFFNIQKQNKQFLEIILNFSDFPIDKLKEMCGNDYETGDFIAYFEFSLADIFYRYLKNQSGIIIHISPDDEMYE